MGQNLAVHAFSLLRCAGLMVVLDRLLEDLLSCRESHVG